PQASMLDRNAYRRVARSVDDALAQAAPPGTHAGYSGFEALLNVATGYLESTFGLTLAMVALAVLLALYVLSPSAVAVLVTIAPVAVASVAALAVMALCGIRMTIFTVVAIPILIGVGTDSSIQVLRQYFADLREKRLATADGVMGQVGS